MSSPLAQVLVALFLVLPAAGASAQDTTAPPASALPSGASEPAPLNLNTATEAELIALPGVGPSKAKAILAFREAHGGFRSVSQLLRIKGFGRATFRRLRPLLVVAPP